MFTLALLVAPVILAGCSGESTAPAAVKFVNAAAATGLGTTNVNATVSVAVPANVFAGTYSSTVTVSIVAGP